MSSTNRQPTLYDWAGGYEKIESMMQIFVSKIKNEEDLHRHFANLPDDHAPHLAMWFSEVLGGPSLYSDFVGSFKRMQNMHRGRNITEPERRKWIALFQDSCDEAGLPNDAEFRAALDSYLSWGSRRAKENSIQGSQRRERKTIPHWGWGESPPGLE
ncbi:group II truncated hemoglobin [Corynebacterium ulcerans]|uniref:group II truncated hemoglobin n=1 Tax=Corynebacterium ulcerans TaxID=65058 RepID=UPI000C7920E1|nr:group II truncated hemoglobin [Corynebacterium ulcerans]MBH5297131.1 group II truncated hemoglobin [Corynebacterium ulcerans]